MEASPKAWVKPLEQAVYDDAGQLTRLLHGFLHAADDLPNFTVGMTCTPCTHNPIGPKGCGEAGAIGSPPAVYVLDAIGEILGHAGYARAVWSMLNALMPVRRRGVMYILIFISRQQSKAINCYSESEDPIYLAGGHTDSSMKRQPVRRQT